MKKAYVPKIYSNLVTSGLERRKATDVAMLELDITVPNGPTPFPPPAYVDYVDIWNAKLYSLGYPGDKPTGTQWNVVGEYKTMSAFPPGVHVIKTDIDGVGGQSGSPVYILDNGDRRLVGVLIGSPVSDCELGYTWVTKLTDWVLDNVVYAPIFQGWGADLSNLDILTYPTRNTVAPNSNCD